MLQQPRSRTPNLANVLLLLGLAAVGAASWVPAWTAARIARIETRAATNLGVILDEASARKPASFADPAWQDEIARAVADACRALGHPDAYVPELQPTPSEWGHEALCFADKHYLFMVVATPPPMPRPPDFDPAAPSPLEAYAWPSSPTGPCRSAFVALPNRTAAFCRNLTQSYSGLLRAPRPGAGQPVETVADPPAAADYRGRDGERWRALRAG
jgi:hypothetical protein